MADIEFKITAQNFISSSIAQIQKQLKALPSDAYKEFVAITPIRSGNARRKTKLKGTVISADYQYADVLDKGRHMTRRGMRGSEQAPQGMTKPTKEFIKKRMKQIMRKQRILQGK